MAIAGASRGERSSSNPQVERNEGHAEFGFGPMIIKTPPAPAVGEIAQRYLGLLEISDGAVLIVCNWLIVSANPAAHALLGLPTDDPLLGRPFLDFISPKNRAAITERMSTLKVRGQTAAFVHHDLIRCDGKPSHVEIALHACGHGGRLAVQVLIRDFSEQRRLEAEVVHLEHYDPLTELPNRIEFLDRLKGAIVCASSSKALLAVVRLNIDNFRVINDAAGQQGGDMVLRQFAARLTRITRSTDTVARLGGDEFGFIAGGLATDVGGVAIAVCQMTKSLGELFVVDGIEIRATVSIGVAVYPVQAKTPDRLMRKSMLAMKYVKQHGGDQCQLYSVELNALDSDETRLREQTVRRLQSLTNREHEVLQLLITGKTNRMIGSQLGISTRTIDVHRRRVMEKMAAKSIAELVHALDHHF
jgi:diguanylate cyclase (GGDEF)-like protein/PAS domain S-box-containing protein